MGLFDSFLKKKSQQEETRLLIEEVSWLITETDVGHKKDLEAREIRRFSKFWEMASARLLETMGEVELPEILQPTPDEASLGDAHAMQAHHEDQVRALLEEVWLRGKGRCRRCHSDRGLGLRYTPGSEPLAVPVRPLSSQDLAAVEEESDQLLESVDLADEKTEDPPAVVEAKRRRKLRRRLIS